MTACSLKIRIWMDFSAGNLATRSEAIWPEVGVLICNDGSNPNENFVNLLGPQWILAQQDKSCFHASVLLQSGHRTHEWPETSSDGCAHDLWRNNGWWGNWICLWLCGKGKKGQIWADLRRDFDCAKEGGQLEERMAAPDARNRKPFNLQLWLLWSLFWDFGHFGSMSKLQQRDRKISGKPLANHGVVGLWSMHVQRRSTIGNVPNAKD